MPVLEWDTTSHRYYEGGVDRGVLFVQNNDGTYANGVAWNGLTQVQQSPSGGDANDLYADNVKYATLRGVEKFGATIEAYTYPDEFAPCDGSVALVTGVNAGGQSRKAFGFSYRTRIGNDTSGFDHGYKIHLVYGATAKPSERNYETINEDPDAITFSWEIETTGVNVTGYSPISHIEIDSRKVDAAKLTAFETTLYGGAGENANSTLPLPATVIAAFT